jgi:large subunit ribosomal protein L21
VYAIVRSGGHQHKVQVGDTLAVDRVKAAPGDSVTLPAVLLVDDGGAITTDAAALAGTTVTAEVVEEFKGPKIEIHLFKNKTGYHRRQGFRSRLTTLRVTGIETGKK